MKSITEEKIVERLIPRIEERVTYTVVQNVIDALEEQIYPPEDMIREELIDEIKEAEKRIREGKGRSFEKIRELKDFLEQLKDDQ